MKILHKYPMLSPVLCFWLLAACAGGGADAEHTALLLRVADRTRDEGNAPLALSFYQRAHDENPDDPRPLLAMAGVLMDLKAYADAGAVFQDILTKFPDNNVARNGLGVALQMAGDFDGAVAAYRAGLELDPENPALLNNLGYALIQLQKPQEAIPLLETLVALPVATVQNRQNLALAYGLAGREAEAEAMTLRDFDAAAVQKNKAVYQKMRGRKSKTSIIPPMPAGALELP
jgi:Flp pilus assembly protein TadD